MTTSAHKALMQKCNRKFGPGTLVSLAESVYAAPPDENSVIKTGLSVVDNYVLGCGGLPTKRVIEVFGEESSAKSSFALTALAGVQRQGGIGILCDAEHALSYERAQLFGVDEHKLVLVPPSALDQVLDRFATLLETVGDVVKGCPPILLVLDSLASTPTKGEIEDGIVGDAAIGERARLMSKAMRVMTPLLTLANATFLIINQTRKTIGPFADPHYTPGGLAVKFHASVRMHLYSSKLEKGAAGEPEGRTINFVCVKNKLAAPGRKRYIPFYFDRGWDNDRADFDHAKEQGWLPSSTRFSQAAVSEARRLLEARGWCVKNEKPVKEEEVAI